MMFEHATAPASCPPPAIWARYTMVKELKVSWAAVGGEPTPEELNTLAECVNIWGETQERKRRVEATLGRS